MLPEKNKSVVLVTFQKASSFKEKS